jgi:small GTP-binding protein
MRFNEDSFVINQKTTIGVDYKAKEIDVDGEIVKLQIWDTAGQERFRSMTSAFYNKAQGVVVTFDVTQNYSFIALNSWISDVKSNSPLGCVIILCANKTDMPSDRWRVRKEEYELFAKSNDLILFETSASTGKNITQMFKEVSKLILLNSRELLSEMNIQDNVSLFDFNAEDGTKKKKKRCC